MAQSKSKPYCYRNAVSELKRTSHKQIPEKLDKPNKFGTKFLLNGGELMKSCRKQQLETMTANG